MRAHLAALREPAGVQYKTLRVLYLLEHKTLYSNIQIYIAIQLAVGCSTYKLICCLAACLEKNNCETGLLHKSNYCYLST